MATYDPRAAAEAEAPAAPPSKVAAARAVIRKAEAEGRTPSVLARQEVDSAAGAKAGAVGRFRTLAAEAVAAAALNPAATEADFIIRHDTANGPCANGKCGLCGGTGTADARAVLAAAEAAAKANRTARREFLAGHAEAAKAEAQALPAPTDSATLAAVVKATRKAEALARAAESSRPGIVGRYSANAERWPLTQLRRMIARESGPECRRSATLAPLTRDEYAEAAADVLAAFLAAAPPAAALKCRRYGCQGDARYLALIDNGVPGTETAVPMCLRHAGHAPGRPVLAPAEPPLAVMAEADAVRLIQRLVKAWHRARLDRLAVTLAADAEAAEGTPAKAAATAMDLVAAEDAEATMCGAEVFLPAALRAANRIGLKLTAPERWAIRWNVHLARVPSGKAAGTLAPTVTSAEVAEHYGATESAVRVGAMRGAGTLAELDPNVIRIWGRGTGRILAALAGPAPALILADGTSIGTEADVPGVMAAGRPYRGVSMVWPDRVPPRPRRDADTGRLVYAEPPAPPKGAGTRRPLALLATCCPPPRVTKRESVPQGPYSGLSLASVPVSTLATANAERTPLAPYWDAEARRDTGGPGTAKAGTTVAPLVEYRAPIRGVGITTPDTANAEARATVARVSARWHAEAERLAAAEAARLAARWGNARRTTVAS